MKKLAILTSALLCAACSPVQAAEVDVYGAIEVGGYYNDSAKDDYVSDSNASIGVTYSDGRTTGAVEIDGYVDGGVELDKAWVGYAVSPNLMLQVGKHDSVFDNASGFGDLAIEFGHGASEQDFVGGDIDGASVHYRNGQFTIGASVAALFENVTKDYVGGAQIAGFNGAVNYQATDALAFGAAFSKADYSFTTPLGESSEDSLSWTLGSELHLEKNSFGVNYSVFNNYAADEKTSTFELSHALQVTDNFKIAEQVSFTDIDLTVGHHYAETTWEGATAGIGAQYNFSKTLFAVADYEYNFDDNEGKSFAKFIAEF